MKFTSLILFVQFSYSAYAFNYEECKQNYNAIIEPKDAIESSNRYPLISPFSSTFTSIVQTKGATSSTSQFISSSGACKAYDFKRAQIYNFLNTNLERLRVESAQGSGENLKAFNTILECSDNRLIEAIKMNYKSIYFNEDKPSNVDYAIQAIKKTAEINQLSIYSCKNLNSL